MMRNQEMQSHASQMMRNREANSRYKDFKTQLYKTELCRSFCETGTCPYGSHCQFAHGESELRPVLRHRKFKTEKCRNYLNGYCPYGVRCCFTHEEESPLERCGLIVTVGGNIVFVDDPNPNRSLRGEERKVNGVDERIHQEQVNQQHMGQQQQYDGPQMQQQQYDYPPQEYQHNPEEQQYGDAAMQAALAYNYQQMMMVNPMMQAGMMAQGSPMTPLFMGHPGAAMTSPRTGAAEGVPPPILPVFPGYPGSHPPPHLMTLSPPASPQQYYPANPAPPIMMQPVSPMSPSAQATMLSPQYHTVTTNGHTPQPVAMNGHNGQLHHINEYDENAYGGENEPPQYQEGLHQSRPRSTASSGEATPPIMSMVSVVNSVNNINNKSMSNNTAAQLPRINGQSPNSPTSAHSHSSSRRSNGVPLSPTTHNVRGPMTPPGKPPIRQSSTEWSNNANWHSLLAQVSAQELTSPARPLPQSPLPTNQLILMLHPKGQAPLPNAQQTGPPGFTGKVASSLGIKAVINNAAKIAPESPLTRKMRLHEEIIVTRMLPRVLLGSLVAG